MIFDFPQRSVFEPPSYPNAWFYVDERLVPSQAEAVGFVTGWLRDHCGIVNDFGRFKPPEASDTQARLAGLQPWQEAPDPTLNHAHDLHIRYYYVALRQTRQDRATLDASQTSPMGGFYRFAGSVHYEVEDEHPLHPYIEECPYCGRTGDYAKAEDLFAGVHEPLGLELILHGTIRRQRVFRRDGRPVRGISALQESRAVSIHRLRPTRPDMNVVELAAVVISPKPEIPARRHTSTA